MFEAQAKQELFKIVKAFHACKKEDGQSLSSYLLKMKSYLDILERLGSLCQMNLKDKKKLRGANGKGKGKTKLVDAPKIKIPPPSKKDNPAKDSICHYYKEVMKLTIVIQCMVLGGGGS
nr:zinc finger, CCHC-type [Tanacetum cinerariifolium]